MLEGAASGVAVIVTGTTTGGCDRRSRPDGSRARRRERGVARTSRDGAARRRRSGAERSARRRASTRSRHSTRPRTRGASKPCTTAWSGASRDVRHLRDLRARPASGDGDGRRDVGADRAPRARRRGLFAADGVALGSRRLAIIDLSDAGMQPFATPDGRCSSSTTARSTTTASSAPELEGRGHRFRAPRPTRR